MPIAAYVTHEAEIAADDEWYPMEIVARGDTITITLRPARQNSRRQQGDSYGEQESSEVIY